MQIANNKQLKDLQKDFQSVFPYLKIEFFMVPHAEGTTSDENTRIDPSMRVGSIRYNQKEGFIALNGNMTAGSLERRMHDLFGLYIQVYRKEYKKWRQTWVSDAWTLEEQNRRSRVMGEQGTTIEEIREKVIPF